MIVQLFTSENMTNFYFKINQVRVNTVLGSAAPPLTVKLVRAFHTDAKGSAIIADKVSDMSMIIFRSGCSKVNWIMGFFIISGVCYYQFFEYTAHIVYYRSSSTIKVVDFMSWVFSQIMSMWELMCLFLRYSCMFI